MQTTVEAAKSHDSALVRESATKEGMTSTDEHRLIRCLALPAVGYLSMCRHIGRMFPEA